MTEKEKKIMEKLVRILPQLTKEKQEYLLGYGDGILAARETKEERLNKEMLVS